MALVTVPDSLLEKLGGGRRLLLIATAAAIVAGLWGVSRWASAPDFVTLFADLDLQDAARIEDSLAEAGIEHRLAGGGTEVQVPSTDLARARVSLAKDGVAVGGRPGLELFDKPAWGMTDFSQRVTFQRALEGELARTIAAIRGVDRAQVHLALPAPSPLRRLDRKASASVVLTLKGGGGLSPETIQGIAYVVSNSVENLASDNVAIVDDQGHVLSAPTGQTGDAGPNVRQIEMRRAVEEGLVGKIQGLLEPLLGAGRIRAEVAAEMSFDKVDRLVETFGADGAPADSAAPASEAGNSREVQRSEGSVGKVVRLTAAVLVDESVIAGAKGAPPDSGRLARIETVVRDAIGIDEARGDHLSIVVMPFGAPVLPPGTSSGKPGPDIVGTIERFVRPAVGVVALGILLVLAFKVVRLPALPAGARSAETPPSAGAGNAANGTAGPEGEPEVNLRVVRGWLKQ